VIPAQFRRGADIHVVDTRMCPALRRKPAETVWRRVPLAQVHAPWREKNLEYAPISIRSQTFNAPWCRGRCPGCRQSQPRPVKLRREERVDIRDRVGSSSAAVSLTSRNTNGPIRFRARVVALSFGHLLAQPVVTLRFHLVAIASAPLIKQIHSTAGLCGIGFHRREIGARFSWNCTLFDTLVRSSR